MTDPPTATPDGSGSVSIGSARGAEPHLVGPYLAATLGNDAWAEASVTLISGGKSNLTYVVRSAAGELVLRRPPLSAVLPTAHDMVREFTVISALAGTTVPVPAAVHLCTDESVLGATFYLMSKLDGHVVRESLPPGYADTPAARRAIGEGLIDVLVALHDVDPQEVGLARFGRPEGFLDRQLRRWGRQWEATRLPGQEDLDALAGELAATVPPSGPAGIVHGDYRLDNTMLHRSEPGRIVGVLDWELSTLGDPLADLGLLIVYWSRRGDAAVVPTVTDLPGFPSERDVVERYAQRSGRDVSALSWYVAFGCFKLAVVCAGIVARVKAGAMLGEGFSGVEQTIAPLTAIGRAELGR